MNRESGPRYVHCTRRMKYSEVTERKHDKMVLSARSFLSSSSTSENFLVLVQGSPSDATLTGQREGWGV